MNGWVRVATTLTALVLAVVLGSAASVTLWRTADLRVAANNTRPAALAVDAPRGDIVTADGYLAATTRTDTGARTYPAGDLYADVVGFLSAAAGASGLEVSFGPELSGTAASLRYSEPSDLLRDNDIVGHLHLTLRHDAQLTAANALAEALIDGLGDSSARRAAHAILVDVSTNSVLAMVSTSRAPVNDLALALDERARREALDLYWDTRADPTQPLVAASYQRSYRWLIEAPGPPEVPPDALAAWSGHVGIPLGEPADTTDGKLSAASVAAIITSVVTGRQPLNLRVVDAIYTASPASWTLTDSDDPSTDTLHEALPRTIARTLRERGPTLAPGAAVSAERAALTTTLSQPGPPLWPTTVPTSWLSGTLSSPASSGTELAGGGQFAIAVAPVEAPEFVAVVVAEPQPDEASVSSPRAALGTVTVSVAAALLDAAFGQSDP